ncbi:MAG: PAS domain-containing protein [Prolixibacteraceae bacterium]|nr:PAS domain-containing protein [Prolixibacteraceae bacterium]
MINDEMDFTDTQMLRKKAEELLNEKQKKETGAQEKADVNKLLHELQVHQIELEMQNEELRQAYQTSETALKKYTMLFDLSPMGYFSLDSDGTICDLNFTGADLLGERRFSLINSNFKLFVIEDSKAVFNDFFRKVYVSNAKESCQIVLGYDNKPLCRVYMEGVVTEDEQKCLLSVIDLSKFR